MTNGDNISYNSASSTVSGMIKSEGAVSLEGSVTNTGVMKTILGEVMVSLEPEIVNLDIQNVVMECIYSVSQAPPPFTSSQQLFFESKSLVFLRPEDISLEIELQTLSKEIDMLPLHSESSSTVSVMKPNVSPSEVPINDMRFSTDNRKDYNQTSSSQTPSKFHSSLDSLTQQISAAPISHVNKTAGLQEKPVREQQKSNNMSLSLKADNEEKTFESSKSDLNRDCSKDEHNNREGKNSQDDDSQDQESQNRDEINKKDSARVTSEKEKVSSPNHHLTINDFQYLRTVKPMETSQQTLVKKMSSPLKLFSDMERNKFLPTQPKKTEEDENVFIKYMRLMAKILGQAEAEAHELYLKIKKRTDNVDILTLLTSKINSEKGDIDWKNDEEMKLLIEKARELGVDIPANKYTWNEDEKKLLKENIQMRKDSLEKITQLERTDMQRYLQEASQCHQGRSNILKLLKEVIDTFIYNIRP